MTDRKVIIIGGGVAGLTAAGELARLNVRVDLVERSYFPGGHAIAFACKATDRCVKCGACLVADRLEKAAANPMVRILTGTRVRQVSRNGRFEVRVHQKPAFIDPSRCTGCGVCYDQCPETGAVLKGCSPSHKPFHALSANRCRYMEDRSCTLCRDACPEKAIDLDAPERGETISADAVILATGFETFNPEGKPYGYGVFKNVVTHLEMEGMVSGGRRLERPSDGSPVERLAFVQCVGSRDACHHHLWCSRVCCGASLRMAGLIKNRMPETDITVFYMDVQNFGRDFEPFYQDIRKELRLIRAIPGDFYPAGDAGLRVTYLDNGTGETTREIFDLVVLSVGMIPHPENDQWSEHFGVPLLDTGFVPFTGHRLLPEAPGVFTAGAVTGPMSIAETIAQAEATVWQVGRYLGLPAGEVKI